LLVEREPSRDFSHDTRRPGAHFAPFTGS
jgi:hypothetical protein